MTKVLLRSPGLVSNSPDQMSCLHACVQMVMQTKPKGRVFTLPEIDKILRRKPGLYSWEFAIYEAVSREGFKVKLISTFSASRFVKEGESYLLEYFGEEAGKVQIENSDIPTVQEDAKKFLASRTVELEERAPNFEDIKGLLSSGSYLVPLVNSRVLNGEAGYAGHFIFVYGFDNNDITFHDPGLPAVEGRKVSWKKFDEAWSSPREETRSLAVFRKETFLFRGNMGKKKKFRTV